MGEGKEGENGVYIPDTLLTKPYRIGILSTHGSGKTGLVRRVTADFHALNLGNLVGEVSEVSSEFWRRGLKINKDTSIEAQIAILSKQINLEQEMMVGGAYPIILTDRTVLDNLVYYTRVCDNLGEQGRKYKKYGVDLAIGYIELFPYDVMYRVPMTGKAQATPIRCGDEDFQKDIDARLDRFIKEWAINCIELPPSKMPKRQDWTDIIVNRAIEDLEKRGAKIPR